MTKSEIILAINDARIFQKYCLFDEAITCLSKIELPIKDKNLEYDILKLLSFNYRKLQEYSFALIYINQAIKCIQVGKGIVNRNSAMAVCLMNKGVIYDEQKKYKEAIKIYISAIELFKQDYKETGDGGKLINALINLGIAYYNNFQLAYAKGCFYDAISYFGDDKNNDRRYEYIIQMLEKIENEELKND